MKRPNSTLMPHLIIGITILLLLIMEVNPWISAGINILVLAILLKGKLKAPAGFNEEFPPLSKK